MQCTWAKTNKKNRLIKNYIYEHTHTHTLTKVWEHPEQKQPPPPPMLEQVLHTRRQTEGNAKKELIKH